MVTGVSPLSRPSDDAPENGCARNGCRRPDILPCICALKCALPW